MPIDSLLDELGVALEKSGCFDDLVLREIEARKRDAERPLAFDYKLPLLPLNDRGIRRALQEGVIKSDVATDDVQIQPASLDCRLLDIESCGCHIELYGSFGTEREMSGFGIPAYGAAEIAFTQLFEWNVRMVRPFIILRSSLGRVGIGPIMNAPMYQWAGDERKIGMTVGNYSPNNVLLEKGGKFAQMLFMLNFDPEPFFEDDRRYIRQVSDFLDLVKILECGVEIRDERVLRSLAEQGHLKISPELVTKRGFVVLHASNEAYRLREVGYLNINEKRNDLLVPVDITGGYTPKPGEHLLVKAREQIDLSDRIGIHFLERPVGLIDSMDERSSMRRFQIAATNLVNAAWYDPKYSGIYMAHAKNIDLHPVDIRPGDPIGFGDVYYFPKGVERPYGSSGLGSHYQRARTAEVLQNR